MSSSILKLAFIVLLVTTGCLSVVASVRGDSGGVVILEIQDAIGPATNDYIGRSLESASEQQAELVVIRMDTPGGLDTSMRRIIKSITTSSVPVATFVAPSGARAASAGTYILYASHIAAMAPGTNLGAATPVQLGGLPGKNGDDKEPKENSDKGEKSSGPTGDTKTRKLINDAAAYVRGLAQMRGRNAEWAEKAVREGASLSAAEALDQGVIDLIATDTQDLLRQLNGYAVDIQGVKKNLNTDGLALIRLSPDWRNRLLAAISNPNVAYILMLIGIYGLIYEFSNPGALLPGIVGAICLLLALYAFHTLPVNYAGFALILLGIALMVGEAFAPSFGVLGIGGIVAFVIGSVVLIDTEAPGYGISLPLIIAFAIVSAAMLVMVVGLAIKSRQRPVVSGREQLLGATGRALTAFDSEGPVRVHGEVWHARTDKHIDEGQRVRVTGRDGLTLEVTSKHKNEV